MYESKKDAFNRQYLPIISIIIATTDPFLNSVSFFYQGNKRADMLLVIESGPGLSSCIQSKNGLFNPIVEEIDKVKSNLYKLRIVANNKLVPRQAKNYIYNLIDYVDQIINAYYSSFDQWEAMIKSTVDPLKVLKTNEDNYMKQLNELAVEGTDVAEPDNISFSFQRTDAEKLTIQTSTTAISEDSKKMIHSTLESYYSLLDRELLDEVRRYYTNPVKKWFDSDISPDEIITKAETYYSRWPFHSAKINWSTFIVYELSNGYYSIDYDMDYWLKKDSIDPYKFYYLKISIVMSPDYKINEIDEERVSSRIVSGLGLKN